MGSSRKKNPNSPEVLERRAYAKDFQRPAAGITLEANERFRPLDMHVHQKTYKDKTYGVKQDRHDYRYAGGKEPVFYGLLAPNANTFKNNAAGAKKATLGSG